MHITIDVIVMQMIIYYLVDIWNFMRTESN